MPTRTWMSWSSGKDSAWALHRLRADPDVELAGLLTTFNAAAGRVAMHGVRAELARAQAEALGLPLIEVLLPYPCTNEEYAARMAEACARAQAEGVDAFAFGDLHLADLRAWREQQLAQVGLRALFPLFGAPADSLARAREMIDGGLRATLSVVDLKALPADFAGRVWGPELLADLPPGVDPCGENGEFHTFCTEGPMFARPLRVQVGERVERDGFCFVELTPLG